jgi:hypothetical protein
MQLTDLNPAALVVMAVFSVCFAGLAVVLLFAPQRDCFFLRWHPETRFMALISAPFLIILWPLVLLIWLMRSGIIPDDPDFFDD